MSRAVRAAGVLAALGYVAVLLLTRATLPGGARPVYDGFAPPAPYRYVNPPKALRASNSTPSDGKGSVARSEGATASLAVETGDTQAGLTAALGALGLAKNETGAEGTLVPLDPTTFAALPDRQLPSGNVYRVTVTAVPSGREVTTFAKPVTVSLRVANSAGTTMFTSRDGKSWTKIPTSLGQPYVIASTTTTGYYVLAGEPGLIPAVEPPGKGGGGVPVGLVAGAAVAVLIALAVAVLLRRGSKA